MDDKKQEEPSGVKTLIPCRSRKGVEKEIPVEHVGLISFLTYAWLDGFMWKAWRKGLDPASIWTCPSIDSGDRNAVGIEKMWKEELKTKGPNAKLSTVFLRFVRCRLMVAIVILLFGLACLLFVITYLLLKVLEFSMRGDQPLWKGIVYVVALFIGNMLATILFLAVFTVTHVAAARLRAGVLFMLYKKLLRVVNLQDKTLGEVLNLYANDSQRIFDGISMFPMVFGGPLLGIGATVYAVYLLGPWALIGFVIICLLFPLQGMAGKMFMKFRAQALEITDSRVRAMNEMLSNVRFIKMNSWEEAFAKVLTDIRAKEKALLEKVNISMSIIFLTSAILVAVATMVTLMIITLSGHDVSSVEAFGFIIAYSAIQDKLELCTMTVKFISEFFVAANRCQETMMLAEVSTKRITYKANFNLSDKPLVISAATIRWPPLCSITPESDRKPEETSNGFDHSKKDTDKNGAATGVELQLLSNEESSENTTWSLKNVDCSIERGNVVAIMGAVGSGKSALLSAISGQMQISEGSIIVAGTTAYVPQSPWIFNASVKDNILLGNTYTPDRYAAVIKACCLEKDLAVLSAGDATEIGERGMTISGGQKQRISLARAVYSNREIYILDDPLASVDPDVADIIYKSVISDLLMGKTVLLVTHQVKYAKECDYVLYLRGGEIIEQGSPADLLEAGGEFAQYCSNDEDAEIMDTPESMTPEPSSNIPFKRQLSRQTSRQSTTRRRKESEVQLDNTNDRASLIEEEEKEKGAVSCSTYRAYMDGGGGIGALLLVVFISLVAEGCRAFSYWWLAEWIRDGSGNTTITRGNETFISTSISDNPKLGFYNMVYGLTLLAILIFFILRSVILVKVLMRASSSLHDSLLAKVFHSPMSFFDTTPLGRIINRFSRDMDELDAKMPPMIDNTLKTMLSIILYVILIGAIIHWFLIAIPPVTVLFVFIYMIFRVGLRELKRLLNISMSPLLSHITATLEGVNSIRLYDKQGDFEQKFLTILNHNTCTLLLYNFCMRWINLRLALVTTLIVCLTALAVVLLRDTMPTAYAGVAIIYSVNLLTLFQLYVRFAVETEATFTSVERIRSYDKGLKSEGNDQSKSFGVPSTWPSEGHIRFDDFKLRYRAVLPLVLNGITCDIKPRERVGIVGRTGSGKTSLVSALYRLVEPAGGRIEIDGIDITLISLPELRSKLSIIPQDPVLFAGTVRSNLDPFHRSIDMELWRALEKCHLKDLIEGMEGKLDAPIAEKGDNLSAGQRQLLCMARILLTRSRILILDEATASIDVETEQHIQLALQEAFTECTLLIIAHRLKTVMECDRILVMEDGKVIEFDTPSTLMDKPDSRFRRMMAVISDDGGGSQDSGLDILDSEAWV